MEDKDPIVVTCLCIRIQYGTVTVGRPCKEKIRSITLKWNLLIRYSAKKRSAAGSPL
jgi:hypothetical protein